MPGAAVSTLASISVPVTSGAAARRRRRQDRPERARVAGRRAVHVGRGHLRPHLRAGVVVGQRVGRGGRAGDVGEARAAVALPLVGDRSSRPAVQHAGGRRSRSSVVRAMPEAAGAAVCTGSALATAAVAAEYAVTVASGLVAVTLHAQLGARRRRRPACTSSRSRRRCRRSPGRRDRAATGRRTRCPTPIQVPARRRQLVRARRGARDRGRGTCSPAPRRPPARSRPSTRPRRRRRWSR